MTLGILTTIWQRHALERITLGHLASVDLEGVDLELVAVGSEGDTSRAVARESGWDYVEHPNDPLGAKHNAGMRAMAKKDPDAVLVIGSDDLISESYLEDALTYVKRGANYVGPQTLYILDPSVPRAMYVWGFNIGTGRLVGADLLEACNWQPWDRDLNESLDGSLHDSVRWQDQTSFMHIGDLRERGHAIIDVKTGTNIWSYEHLSNALHQDPADPEQVLAEHFPDVADEVMSL